MKENVSKHLAVILPAALLMIIAMSVTVFAEGTTGPTPTWDKYTVSWDAVEDADSYYVVVTPSSTGTYKHEETYEAVTGTSLDLTSYIKIGVKNNTYTVKVWSNKGSETKREDTPGTTVKTFRYIDVHPTYTNIGQTGRTTGKTGGTIKAVSKLGYTFTGPDDYGEYEAVVEAGDVITVTGTPKAGYIFNGVHQSSIDPISQNNPYTFEVLSSQEYHEYDMNFLEESIKLTIKWSSIDGAAPVKDKEILVKKGNSFSDFSVEYRNEIQDYFKKDGYSHVGYMMLTSRPFNQYSSDDELAGEDKSDTPLDTDTTFYCLMTVDAKYGSFTVEKPVCGTEVSYDRVMVQSNAPVVAAEEDSQWIVLEPTSYRQSTYWLQNGITERFSGTIKGGTSYKAQAYVEPRFGYGPVNDAEIAVGNADGGSAERSGVAMFFTVTAVHDWGEWEEVTDATGHYNKRSCNGCSETQRVIIPDAGCEHNNTTAAPQTEPTCTLNGLRSFLICNDCSAMLIDKDGERIEITKDNYVECIEYLTIPAPGHDWNEERTKEPTCIEEGELTKTCKVCGEAEDETIPASGHEAGDPARENEVEADCDSKGSYDEVVRCTRCDQILSSVYKETEASGHDWGEWSGEKTDDIGRYNERTCARCKETQRMYIPDSDCDHKQKTEVPQIDATCIDYGLKAFESCDDCGAMIIDMDGVETVVTRSNFDECMEYLTIPPTGHTMGEGAHENEVAPGCISSGSYDEVIRCAVCKEELSIEHETIDALGHDWGDWKETKPATDEEEGEEERICGRCGEKEARAIEKLEPTPAPEPTPEPEPQPEPTPEDRSKQMGEDGTPVGKGASAEAAEAAIMGMTGDSDLPGSKFMPLALKSVKQTKKSITVKWSKTVGAVKYVIYGNKCGKKMKKLGEATGNSKTFKKIAGKKVKKGTSYKFIVVALDKDNNVVSTSKLIHAYTKGGKYTNHKSVKIQKKAGKKWKASKKLTMKAGKTVTIRGTGVKAVKKLKYKQHAKMRYESSNAGIAAVSKKGKVKGLKKGTCYVYAYSQNGVSKKIKVTVK